MPGYRIGYIVGSIAGDSVDRALSTALVQAAPQNLRLFEIPIWSLPPHPRGVRDDVADPPEVRVFTQSIESCDGILFIAPEYNRLVTSPVRNAIAWGSCPSGTNSFAQKPTGVIGASPGNVGMAITQASLRSVLSEIGAPQLDAPDVYITFDATAFDDDGHVRDETRATFLRTFMAEFTEFVQRSVDDLEESLAP